MKNKILLFFLIALIFSNCNIYAQNNSVIKESLTLSLNNKDVKITSYKIDNESYFMLRDVAYMLNNSNKKFNITWDKDKNAIKILPSTEYISPSGKLAETATREHIKIKPSLADIYYNDQKIDLTAYVINGSNYFRLEDLMLLFDISIIYDKENKITRLDTNSPYDLNNHVFLPHKNVSVFLYHDLASEKNLPSDINSFIISSEKFENDIKSSLNEGYQSLSLEDYYLNKYNKNKKYFIITFDDGYLSNYNIAYPIIKKYNVYMDIFINTDNMHIDHHFKLNQAKEMEDSGLVKIYSHYPTHIDVRTVEENEYTAMLAKSIATLEEVLTKKDFYFFAYPYSFYDENTYRLTKASNFKLQAVQNLLFNEKDLLMRYNITQTTDVLKIISNIAH